MLDLNHVSMTFNPGTVNEKKALTDINLHMESGEFATIVGSNGAGKSTLFNAIAGSFIPDTGSILLDGVDMTFQPDFRRSKAIGRLFQDPLKGTAPNMTIEENLALAYLRASTHTSPFSRITKADRELFTDRLVQLVAALSACSSSASWACVQPGWWRSAWMRSISAVPTPSSRIVSRMSFSASRAIFVIFRSVISIDSLRVLSQKDVSASLYVQQS